MTKINQYSLNIDQFSLNNEILSRRFPKTRYQGSKRKVLPFLYRTCGTLSFESVLDLYSGTGLVSLLFRGMNKNVVANDYLYFNTQTAELFLSAKNTDFNFDIYSTLKSLLSNDAKETYVTDNYANVYFTDSENREIDNFVQNVHSLPIQKRRILIYGIGQALLKKRPYNLFHRANLNMRLKNVKRSFGNATTWSKSILEHAYNEIQHLASFPFDDFSGDGIALNINTKNIDDLYYEIPEPDLIYLDPPYLNQKRTSVDYSDFYHFLEGLWDYSLFSQPNIRSPHKPLISLESRWSQPETGLEELKAVARAWPKSTLVLSYRSDGLPSETETLEALSIEGRTAHIHHAEEYKYALSKAAGTKENIILSKPANAEEVR